MTEKLADSEYSMQHFGFSPQTFLKDFSEMVVEEMASVVQNSIRALSSPNCKVPDKDKLLKNSIRIHEAWSERAQVVLKKLEPTIKEFFTIPKNVLLPVDEEKATQYSEEDIQKLEEEVKELEEKYAERVKAIQVYKAEIAVLEKLEPVQKKVEEAVSALDRFGETFSEVKELEKVAQTHKECKKMLHTEDKDDDSEESDGLAIHEWKVKTC